jgi:rhomboid protease GluP
MCPNCRAFITTDDKICPYCNTKVGARAVDLNRPKDALGGLIPQARFTTVILLLVNAGIYLASLLYTSHSGGQPGLDPSDRALFDLGGKDARAIFVFGQWWRLVTAGFLHGGTWHILMNSIALFQLGAPTEEEYGTARFLVLYLASSIGGFLASSYWSASLSIGASAAIYGLIGAMIAVGIRERGAYGSARRSLYVQWAIFGLIMSIYGPIDMAAHVGGLITGFVMGFIAGAPGRNKAIELFWQAAAVAMVALTGYAFFRMYDWLIHSPPA